MKAGASITNSIPFLESEALQLMDTVSSVHLDHPSFVCKVDPL
jgi:hypothetical protein